MSMKFSNLIPIGKGKENHEYFYWKGDQKQESDFECGYCGRHTSSDVGLTMFMAGRSNSQVENFGVFICTHCNLPTFITDTIQIPGVKYGSTVNNLSDTLSKVYDEARDSFSVGAYTGVVLLSRKLLMHIAVELGAEPNRRFIEYVNYLDEEGFITARSRGWVDSIRQMGNASTHEIEISSKEDAEKMIKFCEMILKTNFEYPAELEVLDEERES